MFKNFPYARYATYVTFQQRNGPDCYMQNGKKYFSGKQKLYGVNVEVSVVLIKLAIGRSTVFPGSVAEIYIMHQMVDWCDTECQKRVTEMDLEDDGIGFVEYKGTWAIVADKGYEMAMYFLWVVNPQKKPHSGGLTKDQFALNKTDASGKIIVEFFWAFMWTANCVF